MLILNEWRLFARQPMVWLCILAFTVFAALLVQGVSVDNILLVKRLTMLNATLVMLAMPIVIAALTPPLLQRDRLSAMHELIDVTPTTLFHRRLSRFIAFLTLITFICMAGAVAQLVLLTQHPLFNASVVTTAALNLLVIVIPACVLFSTVAMYLVLHVRSALPVYVFFALCWTGYALLSSINGSPILAGSKVVNPALFNAMLYLDPLGFTAIFEQFDTGQANWQPSLVVLINGIIWLVVSAVLLRLFLTARAVENSESSTRTPLHPGLLQVMKRITRGSKNNSTSSAPHEVTYSSFVTLIVAAVQTIMYGRAFALILAIFASIVFTEVISGLEYAEPMAQLEPTSSDALNRVVWDMLPFTGCVLMALWSWQLGWQNQRHDAAEIIAATPVRNAQLIGAHLLALSVVWFILVVTTGVAVMVAQGLADSLIQPSAYFTILLLSGLPVLLFGYLCTAAHHLLNSPIKAGGLCLLFLLVKFTPLPALAGIMHPLLDIAGTPLQPADHLIGFSRSMHTFMPYISLWAGVILWLLIIASIISHRGTGLLLHRWRYLPVPGWLCLGAAVVALCGFHLALKQEKPHMTPDARQAFRASYEKQFGQWAQRAQPIITHIDAAVDFFPERRSATLAFTLQLTNTSQVPITEVLIGSHYQFVPQRITLQQARLVSQDNHLHQQVFALNNPLLPGASLQLEASMRVDGQKMWLPSAHQILLNEFSYLRGIPLLPYVGFVQQFTLRDKAQRIEHGLPPLALPTPTAFATARPATEAGSHPVTVRSIVSTPTDQLGLAQGRLIKTWQQQGRSYREYDTQRPIRNIPVWMATTATSKPDTLAIADQSVKLNFVNLTDNSASNALVQVEQVHTQAVSDTLEWFAQHLTPYPYAQLSVVFTPEFGPSGYALPQLILLSHRLAVRAKPSAEAGFDQRYRRMVHETAHQWFGHTLGYGVNADGSFLIESLAKYAELVMVEQRFGKATMQALVDYERHRYQHYLRGNLTATAAIIDATSNADVYSRATLVFAQLRELVGDEKITAVLRDLLQRNKPGTHSVTSFDFVDLLVAQTPPENKQAVTDLLLSSNVQPLL
ncbi:M1 family aminopeptidase [Alteromonas gilva]|uniref:M1 family aminopeptidase n=1 Tax=Alteromonas gilva TaxID=2987522 RepID=A0ABT5KY10_9ALTE|nr:M1 family aminopeptidase [Alteromonas gilva]MDC8829655.1 M1 family aminopeptidase [Alteromonas gilva]